MLLQSNSHDLYFLLKLTDMWVYCIYDLFLFIVAWFVVEHSLIMPMMCHSVIMRIHGNYWNSPHHWLWAIIDLDEGFFGVESVWRRTQGALIPHSLFSWMSGPFTVQAEGGGWWLSPVALVSLCAAWEGGLVFWCESSLHRSNSASVWLAREGFNLSSFSMES